MKEKKSASMAPTQPNERNVKELITLALWAFRHIWSIHAPLMLTIVLIFGIQVPLHQRQLGDKL